MSEEAFIETESSSRRKSKAIRLPVMEDGSIDWDQASDKHKQAFIDAIKADANGILKNIQEEAGSQPSPDDEPEGIADATVLTAANLVMVIEAIGISVFGHKIAPPLKGLHPVVAIKACTVSMEDIKPVMPAAKRILHRYVPAKYIGQEYQDIAIVGEHLMKLSAAKFKACVDIALEIEKAKAGPSGPNGRVTIIEGDGKVQ